MTNREKLQDAIEKLLAARQADDMQEIQDWAFTIQINAHQVQLDEQQKALEEKGIIV